MYKLLTRKTGRVETSDTVEDNVYIITGQLKLKHRIYAPYLGGGHDVLPSPVRHFSGRVPVFVPVPRGIYAPDLVFCITQGFKCKSQLLRLWQFHSCCFAVVYQIISTDEGDIQKHNTNNCIGDAAQTVFEECVLPTLMNDFYETQEEAII